MARQLCKRGHRVGLVVLLDTYNYGRIRTSWADDLYFRLQSSWFGLRHFLFLNSQGRLTFLRRWHEELWKEEPEISELNRCAALKYVPKAYPGRILHVRPTTQYARYKRPELSLSSLAEAGVEEFWLRGYPPQILEEPLVRDLAAKLRACIDEGVSIQSSPMAPPPGPVVA